jgi:hypothetical protein
MTDEVKSESKKSIMISKTMAVFILIFSFIFIIPPTIGFLHESLKINFEFLNLKDPELFFELVKQMGTRQFGVLCLASLIILVIAIYKNIKNKKYKLHAFSGMLGLSLSLFSISIISFYQHPSLVFLFILSGFLCAYCISVPIYLWCFERFKNKQWEPIFITVVFGGVITY